MLQNIRRFFYAIKPIALSHHPLCQDFQDGKHTIHLFGKDWCIGCFVTYPIAILSYLIFSLTGLYSRFTIIQLWQIGMLLCGTYIFSILGLTKFKSLKIITKFLIGNGIAFGIAGFWRVPISVGVRILLILTFLNIGHFFILSMRGLSIYSICKECSYQGKWKKCPGMGDIFHRLKQNSTQNKTKK